MTISTQLLNNNRESHTALTRERLTKNLSSIYAPVSTELLLQPFYDKGWVNKRKVVNKKGTKEWFTLSHPNYLFDNGDELTLDVLNSYNGTSALKIFFGVGRIVCLNGMVVGDMDHFKYVHRGNQIYQNIENDYEKIVAKLIDVKKKVERLNNIYLSPSEVNGIIDRIATKVFEVDGEKNKIEVKGVAFDVKKSLLESHREADRGEDAWIKFNVIQENIVRLGRLSATVSETNKELNTTVIRTLNKRSNENKLNSFQLNKIISDEFFKAVA